jgi:prepilin-type N-terminal cleavage/methylation domain-containing protein
MTLIELMIAMAIISIGLLAMWQLHVVGITSNAAARRRTQAMAIASELSVALERLPFTDAVFLVATGPAGSNPPTPFGQLVDGSGTIASGATVWSDSIPVPGVRLTTQIREMSDPNARFERRWTVWDVLPVPSGLVGAKVIAVSVTWNDVPFARPREVVQYTYVSNPAVIAPALGSSP